MARTEERKIYFHRIDAGLDHAGVHIPFDVVPALNHIERLPFDESGKYEVTLDGDLICCWVDGHNPNPQIRMGCSRKRALPQIEIKGVLLPLEIPNEASLSEQIHIVFFPNNIIGSDFNFYAPRLRRLESYLAQKAKHICKPITIEPLLRRDVTEQLNQFRSISMFSLRIDKASTGALAEVDESLADLMERAIEMGNSQFAEITLTPALHSRKGTIASKFLDLAKGLPRRRDDFSNGVRAYAKGRNAQTDRVELIDIFSDKLIVKKQIILSDPRHRTLDKTSAYRAISDAYDSLRDDLIVAPGIRII